MFTGPTIGAPDDELTVRLIRLSTRTFPVLSAVHESTAVIGDAVQFRFSVELLNATELLP